MTALQDARPAHGPGRGHHGRGFGLRGSLDVAATTIGVTEEELRTALQGGSTIAAVATEHGVEPQAVIDAIVADVTTRINEKVAAGDLTQEEADARLAELTERVTTLVNEGRPARPTVAADETDEAA